MYLSAGRRFFSSKVFQCASDAINDMISGSTLLVGGFGLCGIPENLITAIEKRNDLKNLTLVSNNCGLHDFGLGKLVKNKQVKRMICSYIGNNRELERQYLTGEIEIEFTPQGSLAEKLRCGGAGIPAFFTPTGYGTIVATGGFPIKLARDGKTVLISSQKREVKNFHGKNYLLEHAITGDYAIIKGWKGDSKGNIIFRKTARNFNHDAATAGKITIAEVEELVEEGELPPDDIHLPGVYVHRIFKGVHYEKRIEQRTVQDMCKVKKKSQEDVKRETIARRAAMELKNGMYVNLGVGIPTLVSNFLPSGVKIDLHAENGMLGYGGFPKRGEEDPDLINAGKQTISENPGCVYFKSSDSFSMVRGKHLSCTILGALQVSRSGDIANWIIPGQLVKGMGGAMDLCALSKVIVTMEHTAKGKPKILEKCTLPLTGKGIVSKLITDMCVFDFQRDNGMTLIELQDGVTVDQVRLATGCNFNVASDLKSFKIKI